MLALTMLVSAIWLGLSWANRIVAPIRRLIRAADQVAGGDLGVQVSTRASDGDIGHLGDTFNKMTSELMRQQTGLIEANALNDERRAFIEAVLSGVPAGVLGVDNDGVVTISQRRRRPPARRRARPDRAPARRGPAEHRGDLGSGAFAYGCACIRVRRPCCATGASASSTSASPAIPPATTARPSSTLDDISDLVSAQRTAAWADVARRIAHEIKNPLTPIQLSAERLKRRYGKHIVEGKDIFDQCTDTIIRQVDDIKRMVDEFSSFARMPKARPARDDLVDCVRQAVFLQRVGRADLEFEEHLPGEPVALDFDRRLVSQALTNVLKNAGEGVDALPEPHDKGRIVVRVGAGQGGFVEIAVSDNGKGLSEGRPAQAGRALCDDAGRRDRARPADRGQDFRGPRRPGRPDGRAAPAPTAGRGPKS